MSASHPDHLITSLAALAARYGEPSERSRSKVRDRLSAADREWLACSGFLVLASVDADTLDVSPRGDVPEQAFHIMDERTVLLPDRRGNNRIDTLRRLIADPRVALLFLVRGEHRVLRVRGTASISIDPALLSRFELDGEQPATVIVVRVSGVLMQNARAVRRAGLWDAEA